MTPTLFLIVAMFVLAILVLVLLNTRYAAFSGVFVFLMVCCLVALVVVDTTGRAGVQL